MKPKSTKVTVSFDKNDIIGTVEDYPHLMFVSNPYKPLMVIVFSDNAIPFKLPWDTYLELDLG